MIRRQYDTPNSSGRKSINQPIERCESHRFVWMCVCACVCVVILRCVHHNIDFPVEKHNKDEPIEFLHVFWKEIYHGKNHHLLTAWWANAQFVYHLWNEWVNRVCVTTVKVGFFSSNLSTMYLWSIESDPEKSNLLWNILSRFERPTFRVLIEI